MHVKSSVSLRKHKQVGVIADIWPRFGEGGKGPQRRVGVGGRINQSSRYILLTFKDWFGVRFWVWFRVCQFGSGFGFAFGFGFGFGFGVGFGSKFGFAFGFAYGFEFSCQNCFV